MEIGSDVISVLPAGRIEVGLNVSMRFDTTTAWDALVASPGTKLVADLEFVGVTLPSSDQKEYLSIRLPNIYVSEGGDPELSGPDEILKNEISFTVLADSISGYPIQVKWQNATENY